MVSVGRCSPLQFVLEEKEECVGWGGVSGSPSPLLLEHDSYDSRPGIPVQTKGFVTEAV